MCLAVVTEGFRVRPDVEQDGLVGVPAGLELGDGVEVPLVVLLVLLVLLVAVGAAAVRGAGAGLLLAARALQRAVLERGGGERLRFGAARSPVYIFIYRTQRNFR